MQKKMYLLCFVYCVCIIAVTGIGVLQLFTVSIPHKQTVFPLKLMESNSNLFGKWIPLYCLPVWFQYTTNKNRTTTAVLYVFQLLSGR